MCVVLCCVCLQRRVDSGTSLNRLGRKIRTSWQETDIDRAIAEAERTSSDVRILVETWKVCVCVCVCCMCVAMWRLALQKHLSECTCVRVSVCAVHVCAHSSVAAVKLCCTLLL